MRVEILRTGIFKLTMNGVSDGFISGILLFDSFRLVVHTAHQQLEEKKEKKKCLPI